MNSSPFDNEIAFQLGSVIISQAVVTTWAIILVLVIGSILLTNKLKLLPSKTQAVLELLVTVLDEQIRDTMQTQSKPYRGLIGSIFLFVLIANWSSLIPGIDPPTATLETDAALAIIVFIATIVFGVRSRGVIGYLKTFMQPSWLMIPVNLFQQFTRTFSMIIRLFGNVMSGVFIISIVLSLAALIVPIPLMALDLLTGTVQAYIFAILSMVFIGAAINGEVREQPQNEEQKKDNHQPIVTKQE